MSLLQHLFPALVATSTLALGLTQSARAQLNVNVTTVEWVNVRTTYNGIYRSATVPAGRIVSPSMDAFVSHNASNYARVQSTLTTASDSFVWNYRTLAGASNSLGSSRNSSRAEGALRLRAAWNGPGLLLARVRVTVTGDFVYASGPSYAQVDVDDDGTIDAGFPAPIFYQPTYERVIQLGAGGINIRARAFTQSFGGGLLPAPDGDSDIVVELEPIRIVPVGVSCGPQITGVLRAGGSHGLLDLYVTGSPPTTWGLFAVGTSPSAIPLPPTGCMLYVDATTYVPVPVSAAGTAQVLNTALPAVLGLGAYFQFLAQDSSTPGTDWYTTQALWVTAL